MRCELAKCDHKVAHIDLAVRLEMREKSVGWLFLCFFRNEKFDIFSLSSENFRIKFHFKNHEIHKSVQGLTLNPVYMKV